jgi:hypothetical protein
MRLTLSGFLLLIILLLPFQVRADWQNTKWNMTVAQVRAVTGARVPTPAEQSAGTIARTGQAPQLVEEYRSGSIPFQARFFFSASGGLDRVILNLTDYSKENEVINALTGKYGAPIEKTKRRYGMNMRWVTKPDNLIIDLYDLESIASMSIIYSPAINAASPDL